MNLTINLGAATASVTGGTATSFVPNGKIVNGGGIVIVNAAETDPTKRQVITARASTPVYNNTKLTWSDESRELTFAIPVLKADGSYFMRSGRLKMNFEAGITAANLAELRVAMCQLAMDAELDSYYASGSM